MLLNKRNFRKASGPDHIVVERSTLVYFARLFNLSFRSNAIPALCKISIMCPVHKQAKPVWNLATFSQLLLHLLSLNTLRIMLHRLLRQTKGNNDPLLSAYKRIAGVDVILSLLQDTYTYPDKECFIRFLFVYTSVLFISV